MEPTIKNHAERIIGYKAVKKDKGGYFTDGLGKGDKVYFELNKTYSVDGKPELCKNGIHFFRYYCFALDFLEADNAILKVESLGDVQEDTFKCVTNKIRILELDYEEKVDGNGNSGNGNSGNWNSGYGNSGYGNSGNRNSGYENSGNWNSGYGNSGNWNSGNGNSGYGNSGNWNSGYENSGNGNSGYENSGNWNSGNWNSGNRNSGNGNSGNWNSGNRNSGNGNSGNWNSGDGYRNYFCTKTKYFLFDVECGKEDVDAFKKIDMSWFNLSDGYEEAWKKCPVEVLEQIKKLKNFDADKFKEITGVKV